MNTLTSNSLSVSVRVYRALLVAYPKRFREHYETQLVQVFRDSFRDAYRHNGVFGVIDLWLHICVDLFVTALIERFMERSLFMFSPRVILWGGMASVVGGLFWVITGLGSGNGGLFWFFTRLAPTGLGSPIVVLALVLGLGGLAGLYSRQSEQGGRLGRAGFALGILGTLMALAALGGSFTSSRFSVERDPTLLAPPFLIFALAMIILGVGIVLLGATSLRGKALHRWEGLSLGLGLLYMLGGMAFWLVYYLPLSQGQNPWDAWSFIGGYVLYHAVFLLRVLGVLLGLGWMGLGLTLATEADAKVAQPPPASA